MNQRIFMNIPRKLSVSITDGTLKQQLILRKGRFESFLHITMKVGAFLYFWPADGFIIEPNYRLKRYKPDLLKMRPSELPSRVTPVVDIWVECKSVKIYKLLHVAKLVPHSQLYWFHKAKYFENNHRKFFKKRDRKRPVNLKLIGIELSEQDESILKQELLKNSDWYVEALNKEKRLIFARTTEKTEIKLVYKEF